MEKSSTCSTAGTTCKGSRGQPVHVHLAEDDPEVRAALESLRLATAEEPDRSLDRVRLAAFVQRVLDHLPSHYADALEWKYIDEVPVEEIATRLGLGLKAAESLLTRARGAFVTRSGPSPPRQNRRSPTPRDES